MEMPELEPMVNRGDMETFELESAVDVGTSRTNVRAPMVKTAEGTTQVLLPGYLPPPVIDLLWQLRGLRWAS